MIYTDFVARLSGGSVKLLQGPLMVETETMISHFYMSLQANHSGVVHC